MGWGFFALVVVGSLVLMGGPAGALTITLKNAGNNRIGASAYDGVGGVSYEETDLTELPYSDVI